MELDEDWSPLFPEAEPVNLEIDHREYTLLVSRKVHFSISAPRLAIVSYLPNSDSVEILKACVYAIRKFTPDLHELWIIDNNSPIEHLVWLKNLNCINLIMNRTEPVQYKNTEGEKPLSNQLQNGSYANAIALEIFVRTIDAESEVIFPLHMDTMPCHSTWLSYLVSQLNQSVKAAGVRIDHTRNDSGVLHVLGYAVDFQVFKNLRLSFFPDLPKYDVGDLVTVELLKAGYQVFACRNSLWDPSLIEKLPLDSPFRMVKVDRSFDNNDNVIFLHLGRGIRKAIHESEKGTSVEQWLQFAYQQLLV